MTEIQIYQCGKPKDHKCNSDGPVVAIKADGTEVLESEARKDADFPRGYTGGSVTCSVCGLSAAFLSAWD